MAASLTALLLASHLVVATAAGADVDRPEPSPHGLVFFNARLALRDKRPSDALKLWLLRNGLVDRTGRAGEYDADFRSVVWASLGNLGLCQDGFPKDNRGGAGLWPLALHNWVANALNKGPALPSPSTFAAFEVGRQQRLVSLSDVLSEAELRSATFFRTACWFPETTMYFDLQRSTRLDLTDRISAGVLMQELLQLSLRTLDRRKVRGVAPLEARVFDLDLALAEMAARRARKEGAKLARRARVVGLSPVGVSEIQRKVSAWHPKSRHRLFLRRSLAWTPEDWLSLSSQRRQFLFAHAIHVAEDRSALERLALAIIDGLIDRGEGEEVEAWIGFLQAKDSPELKAALVSKGRGKRLLELGRSQGFRERAVVALHRGVSALEAGELPPALSAFAFAMAHAEEGRDPAATSGFARRWLSFVLARYQTDDEVIATLKALVPRQEYNAIVEDLVWRAALRADARSFERVSSTARGSAFDHRAARLRLLATGKPAELATELRRSSVEEPYSTLRFLRQLFERLEAEDPDVRAANAPLLQSAVRVLEELGARSGTNSSHARSASELVSRAQAVLEGLRHLDASTAGKARGLSPRQETFAGNLRVAPAGPLPWPFVAPEPDAPSAFTPLSLKPVEWRDERGALVFGWSFSE